MKIYHPYYQAFLKTGIKYYYLLYQKEGGGDKPHFDIQIDYCKINKEYQVFIGDKRECVLVLIDKDNHEKVAVLEKFSYNPLCSVDDNLKRGSGMRRMMRETFRFIKKKFGIKRVELMDKSYIVCSLLKKMDFNKNRRNDYSIMNLYKLYLFTKGKPYYVYHFGFKYGCKYIKEINRENREKIKKIEINKTFINELKKSFRMSEIEDEKQKWFFTKLMKTENICDFIKRYNKKSECDMFFIFLNEVFLFYRIQDITYNWYYKDI